VIAEKRESMDFSCTPLKVDSSSLQMEYFLVPWDSEIVGRPVAQACNVRVVDEAGAEHSIKGFRDWLETEQIALCSCRVPHEQATESRFLQRQGFRFIELNYRPVLQNVQGRRFSTDGIEVLRAAPEDEDELAQMAARTFRHGRFHQDPTLGAEIGNRRYETWLRNSFRLASQTTYKIVLDGLAVGFFVVEYPEEKRCFWSLIGLAPALEGKGLGTRVWNTMASFHQQEGMESIETSISSHNTAVFNLYVKLGYRFPMPQATFHWHR
jgi:ribosomal protein S18 acetylase RimI-like enzyme